MTDFEDFTAPRPPPYLTIESGAPPTRLTMVREDGLHEKFKCGKDPAKVWVVDHAGKLYRWSITSTQLRDSLKKAESHFGTLVGVTLLVSATGEEKEREYRLQAPKDDKAQQRLTA